MSSPDLNSNSTEEDWDAAMMHRNGSRNRSTIVSDISDEFVPIQRPNTPVSVRSTPSSGHITPSSGRSSSTSPVSLLTQQLQNDSRRNQRTVVGRDAADVGKIFQSRSRPTWRDSWSRGGRRRTKRRGSKTGKKTRRGKRGRKSKKARRNPKRKSRK